MPFFGCSKILGEAGKQDKCFENSRSQIVFRTDILPKIVVGSGAPNENIVQNHLHIALLNVF